MSYILDALRKADSERERERGAVPNIHAQPAPPAASDADEPASKVQPLVWAVAGLSVVVLALLAWLFFGRSISSDAGGEAQQVRVTEAPPVMPRPQQAPPQMPVQAMVPPPAQMSQQMPPPAQVASPPPRVIAQEPARLQTQPAPASTQMSPATAPPVPLQAAPVVPPRPANQSTKSASDDRILTMDELPDDVRRQLPNFSINGSKYSDTPTSRILIINGQVFHEGDRLTPDLTLEQIKVKTAVLRFRGYRYSMAF